MLEPLVAKHRDSEIALLLENYPGPFLSRPVSIERYPSDVSQVFDRLGWGEQC